GMSEYEARKRIDTQNPQRDKLAKASAVITNNGSPEDVWVQVQREWNKILQARGLGQRADEVRTVEVSQKAQAQARSQEAPTIPSRPTTPKPPTSTQPAVPAQPAATQQAPAQPAPANPRAQPAAAQPPAAAHPAPAAPRKMREITKIDTRGGMPKHAEEIARLINTLMGKSLSRNDIMMAFGEKSYLLAEVGGR